MKSFLLSVMLVALQMASAHAGFEIDEAYRLGTGTRAFFRETDVIGKNSFAQAYQITGIDKQDGIDRYTYEPRVSQAVAKLNHEFINCEPVLGWLPRLNTRGGSGFILCELRCSSARQAALFHKEIPVSMYGRPGSLLQPVFYPKYNGAELSPQEFGYLLDCSTDAFSFAGTSGESQLAIIVRPTGCERYFH